ncbi:MAG: hypothetical protein J6S67_25145 [Methanobrevibacter sp.]|nr:hypothetical protein [Methanobrevibacter sp.]
MSENEIKVEIAKAKEELANVKGTNCEVFSRVCGYLRPVQNYNKGKKEEFFMRSKFKAECSCN